MVGVLIVLFLIVPLAELYVIIQVGQAFGALNTIALLIIVSAAGAWLVKREGMSVWHRFQRQVESGTVPGKEIADGVMILFAGALLMTPGFLTDLFGIALLLPPVRAVIRGALMKQAARRAGIFRMDGGRMDGGRMDGGRMDGGRMDGGRMDGGRMDGGRMDGGRMDGRVERFDG